MMIGESAGNYKTDNYAIFVSRTTQFLLTFPQKAGRLFENFNEDRAEDEKMNLAVARCSFASAGSAASPGAQ